MIWAALALLGGSPDLDPEELKRLRDHPVVATLTPDAGEPFRVTVASMLGNLVIQAKEFETEALPSRHAALQ